VIGETFLIAVGACLLALLIAWLVRRPRAAEAG
jgi:hypothetical protein